jgi:lipoprotein-releasing system permease protein
MKFPEFVALRYFFQRKNWNVVHIISIISLVGIGVASMALIIVLSVFNGFTDVAERMLAFSNPDIIIESQKGKSFSLNDVDAEKIANVVGVKNCVNVVSETVLMSFADRQTIVNMIGTTEDYTKLNSIDSTMRIGTFSLGSSSAPNAVLGLSLAINLGIGKGADKMNLMLHFCSPKNNSSLSFVPEENLNEDKAVYSGSFMTAGDMDADVAFVPLAFAQNLLEYEQDRISSIHVSVEDDKLVDKVKELNAAISKDSALGKGFCIGHSYFCGHENETDDNWLSEIVEYDIIPMISEYWFDDNDKLLTWKNNLRGVLND